MRIRVHVINPNQTEKTIVEVPADVELGGLLDVLVERMGLPVHGQNGRRIRYKLARRNQDSELAELSNDETLADQGVVSDTTLQLIPEMVAGADCGK